MRTLVGCRCRGGSEGRCSSYIKCGSLRHSTEFQVVEGRHKQRGQARTLLLKLQVCCFRKLMAKFSGDYLALWLARSVATNWWPPFTDKCNHPIALPPA